MKILKHNSPLVSVDWLNEHKDASNLIVLDATINKVIDSESKRILKARFFDIKNKFSDVSAPYPSTLPSKEQFQNEARNLGINNDSCLVVYDDKGIYSSARVWWLFKVFGFNNVAVLDGGLPEWTLKNFPIQPYVEDTYQIGNITVEFNLELMTDFDGINQFIKDSNVLIIDARSEARFKCLVDEPREGLRRGTIPNSKNLPFTDLINGNTLKPIGQLSEIFSKLETKNRTMLFSCGSGITACVVALAATLCNYKDLIVYDGSWTEYGSLTE
ncbi:sulfurtransferase [Winogradskyella endarachnes]|uniref:Sulfurtransferase n=1 Tax=Winogradskyella endarachnes TaxID=2681965 RepID=A0A6L6U4K7_9FLAO|nr:sulfurtransferase [Winogradskyella endarachnes]MUU77013.1 sulfurtransferase [Winogradskyella endarachnes]